MTIHCFLSPSRLVAILTPRILLFVGISALSAILLSALRRAFTTKAMSAAYDSIITDIPTLQNNWRAALDTLPSTPDNIPSFFFGHGSPMLVSPPSFDRSSRFGSEVVQWGGPQGALATFLRDFGPAILVKYRPKAIVVFSAHWETADTRMVTDYGDENPLLYDYYNFPPEMYEIAFKSRGDSAVAQRVVDLFTEAGLPARLTPKLEPRGKDGRGFMGPGLDHGVFVPFSVMFGESASIPIIQASIDSNLSPEANIAVGRAVAQLRKENVLVLSGGLTMHNLRDFTCMAPFTARDVHKDFHLAISAAAREEDGAERTRKLKALTAHPGFHAAHPREEHFVPIYVALGAGGDGDTKLIADIFGAHTIAFGL
ncbi:LigB domain-containing protein [Mycena kentingensis (nom. inval.)]|nr:LigB domain-containing protein [Mycena kentingensis (nom. inval.)]